MKDRLTNQTPLAALVTKRLDDMHLTQSGFCRLTGFDQGLLSKIQSSMITTLSLETALRLAVGLAVEPQELLSLIGRADLHELVVKAYPAARPIDI